MVTQYTLSMDDIVQIEFHGFVVGEVLDDDDEDRATMETTGTESMTLSE
jgi:hypothetical protein